MQHNLFRRLMFCVCHRSANSRLLKLTLASNSAFHTSTKTLIPFNDKDLPIPTQMTPLQKLYTPDTDILLEELRKANSIERLLELTAMHLDVMNNNHISTTFVTMINQFKENKSNPEEINLTDNKVFQSLCSRVIDRARFLEPTDVISIYKTLCYLNIRSNTYVMQALLKMLCSQINELNLSQLTFLNFLLAKQRRTPLVDSLTLALPLVLQVQIDQQLDSDNIQEVIICLRMACQARLKPAAIEKVIRVLQSKVSEFSASHAATVLLALFVLETPVDGYMQLLRSSFKVVSNDIEQLPRPIILQIVRFGVKNSFYDCGFFMRLCKRATMENWTLEETYELIHRMHASNFFSPELLDHLANKVCQNASDIMEVPRFNHINLAEYFSFANYQPTKLGEVFNVLSAPCNKLDELLHKLPYLYLKMICCWAIMGYFPKNYLNRILNETFLYLVKSQSNKMGRSAEFEMNLCYLQWALEVFDQRNQFRIPVNFMKKIHQSVQQTFIKSTKFPLTKFLENGLGGAHFFQTAVSTHDGHIIDHVLAMRSGNYPVTLSSATKSTGNAVEVQLLESLNIPHDAKIIAVIVANENDFCTDPEILKSYIALRKRHLSKMSMSPVIVNFLQWSELPDREKIPFLMREIKDATENDDIVTSNSHLH